MKNNRNIKLKTYDDIFNVIESLPENDIKNIDINLLVDFRDHPFKVIENKEMDELYKSIKENGILVPVLVRPLGEKFEIVSGHRRKYCAVKIGLQAVPCIVKDMEYDDAIFLMLDSNIQRKNILPSEKAFSFKMKLEATRRQGERTDLTSRQVVDKLNESTSRQVVDKLKIKSVDYIGEDFNESGRNVQRYIRLTELRPFLLDAVDKRKLAFGAAVELSYISGEEQEMLIKIITEFGKYPSLAQTKDIRSASGNLNEAHIKSILFGDNKDSQEESAQYYDVGSKIIIEPDQIKQYFPSHFTNEDMAEAIIEALRKKQFFV